jgi:hypothetical protein
VLAATLVLYAVTHAKDIELDGAEEHKRDIKVSHNRPLSTSAALDRQ